MNPLFPVSRSGDPEFNDPRYQRRIVETHRPLSYVDNMHDVTLECGHAPLVFCTPDPQVGQMMFCPNCHAEGTKVQ